MSFIRTHVVVAGIVIFLIAAGVVGFFIFKKSYTVSAPQAILRPLPDVVFKDMDGNTVAMASFTGRPVILDIWTSWCQLCVPRISHLIALQKEFGDKLVIIEVNRGESLEIVKKYAEQIDTNHHLFFVLDADDSLYRAIGGFSMPETLFVDKEGNIADHTRGPMGIIEIGRRIQDSFDL